MFQSVPGLSDISSLNNTKTRSISAENPTGEPGKGGMLEVPDDSHESSMLGRGWKVKPCITLEPLSTFVLADIEGPGTIKHIWITSDVKTYRGSILKMYWDDETTPSVEVPLGDFFCNGNSIKHNIDSLPIVVNPTGGFNSYWPMPFGKHARIEIENQMNESLPDFFYQITYELGDVPDNSACFHAQWRRSLTTYDYPEHIIVDGIQGQGHYAGTYLAWTQLSKGWWGEGEIKFYMDGDKEFPTICGTGTEDYFGGAWCFGDTYSTPFLGYPMHHRAPNEVIKHGLYRWHIPDPIRFDKDLIVTIQALGWNAIAKFRPLQDDISSVAYWYQSEPHVPHPKMLPLHLRWPR